MKSDLASLLARASRITWRMEEANGETVVFYQLADGEAAEGTLHSRLSAHRPLGLVLTREPRHLLHVPYHVVPPNQWAGVLASACDQFFPLPAGMKIIGVTGTNGKTTTVDLVLQLLEGAGLKGFSLGTLGVRSMGTTLDEFGMTTPGQLELRRQLHRHGQGADFVAMEVSSHALDQDRLHGLRLTAAAWTSFTQDHLDYHGSMEAYAAAKEKIFGLLLPGASLYVPAGQTLLSERLAKKRGFKQAPQLPANFLSSLPPFFRSRFNRENLECALAIASELGVSPDIKACARLLPPPGRFHVREWDRRTVIVDFAHTPDAVENVLKAAREAFPGRVLVALFGCGGDRDRSKRPLMGAAAARGADRLVLTSDNPRTEDPMAIIDDIIGGLPPGTSYSVEPDRPKAVRSALAALREGEVLVMAGKGHEDYIQVGAVKHPYSDVAELEAHIKRVTKEGHG